MLRLGKEHSGGGKNTYLGDFLEGAGTCDHRQAVYECGVCVDAEVCVRPGNKKCQSAYMSLCSRFLLLACLRKKPNLTLKL